MLRTVVLTILLLLPALAARAGLYSFVDEAGVRHFTNVPMDPRYRPMAGWETARSTRLSSRFDAEIQAAARRHGLAPGLIKAVISVESAFDRHAVSAKGAMGLMQLMPATARALSVTAPFDPQQNILAGSRYLRMLLDRFQGNLELALAAYNAGPERIRPEEGLPPIAETRTYVRRVLRAYRRLHRQDGTSSGDLFMEAAR